MMVAMIYVILSAKRISIRRLCLFYMCTYITARAALSVARAPSAGHSAFMMGVGVALTVWACPLATALWRFAFGGGRALESLYHVSTFVRFTYGFAVAAILAATASQVGIFPTLPAVQAILFAVLAGLGILFIIPLAPDRRAMRKP